MKRLNILFLILSSLTFVSCAKYNLEEPQFEVSVAKNTFKAGEEIIFKFEGSPDNITFFSGETGRKYVLKDRFSQAGKAELQFTSFRQNNKPNTLKFLASTDFAGLADSASITNATWIDLTSKVTLSTGTDNTPSGVVDLTDLQSLNKPVYFAFRFTDVMSATAQATWTIRNFVVRNIVDNISYQIMDMNDAAFGRFSMINRTNIWTISATGLRFTGGAANTPGNDAWVIARPADLSFVTKDVGVAIKDINLKLPEYRYTFTTPGTYKVTFLAQNANLKGSKTLVKNLDIVIEP